MNINPIGRRLLFVARVLVVIAAASGGHATAAAIVQDLFNESAQIAYFSPIGQTFTAEDPRIQSIGFLFQDLNPTFDPPTLEMKLFAGAGFEGALLASNSFSLPAGINRDWVDVDFGSVTLTPGDTYSIQLVAPSIRWGIWTLNLTKTTEPGYLGGAAIFQGVLDNERDHAFRVLPAAVPIPAGAYLFGSGLIALGGLVRSRGIGTGAAGR